MAGLFLALEGVDGSGKSTQVERLAAWLRRAGETIVQCRDPGGTAIGEEIRRLLLDAPSDMSFRCEMLLYLASRAQLVQEVVWPALAEGRIVLCDRSLLSTIVYQGYASGLDVEEVRRIALSESVGIVPDWIGVLDVELDVAAGRRSGRGDRVETRPEEFHAKLRRGYLAESQRDPERVRVIDASAEPEVVHQRVVAEVRRVLDKAGRS